MMKYFISLLVMLVSGVAWATAVPRANLTVSPSVVEAGKPITFDAGDSRNSNGIKGGLEYRFKFTNGGRFGNFGSVSRANFTLWDTGRQRVTVEIRDRKTKLTSRTFRDYRVSDEKQRHAKISTLTPRPRAGEPVLLRLEIILPRGEDPDDTTARWDWEGNGKWDTGFLQQKTVAHVYNLMQTRSIRPMAEVKYPDGSTEVIRGFETTRLFNRRVYTQDFGKLHLTPPPVVAPIVNVSPGQTGFSEKTLFTLDASSSRVPRNGWLEWSFDGEEQIQSQKKVTKQFTSPGDHDVRVRTCVNRNNPICEETTLTLNVKPNPTDYRLEISSYNTDTYNLSTGGAYDGMTLAAAGDRVRFNATPYRYYSTGGTLQYRWDFDGDGIYDTPFQVNGSAEYTFARPGRYAVTVQSMNNFTDNPKQFVKDIEYILVLANHAPQGDFTVNHQTIYPNQWTAFRAQATDDLTTTGQLEYRWDLDGDGYWESKFETGSRTLDWKYQTPGHYIATLQIRDRGKKVTTIRRTVTVTQSPTPQARVTISQKYGPPGSTFTLDASESQGAGLRYLWSMPENNTTQAPLSQNPRKSVQFTTLGAKQIILTVVDRMGRSNSIRFSVYIQPLQLAAQP